jgi:amino acid transporter
MDFGVTVAALATAAACFAFASWRAAQPADPLRPRFLPWRTLVVVSGVVGVIMLVHFVNLLGIETGRR